MNVSKPNIIPKESPFKKVVKFAEAIETENNESPNTDVETISCGISHTTNKENFLPRLGVIIAKCNKNRKTKGCRNILHLTECC